MKEKILAAFENLGFNLEDNESLGYPDFVTQKIFIL